MYQAKNTQTGEVYEARTIKELALKTPTAPGWDYNPKPSTIIRDCIETGLIVPTDGPDWYMALEADATLVASREAQEQDWSAQRLKENQASTERDAQIKAAAERWGIEAWPLTLSLKRADYEGVFPQFSSPEHEQEYRQLLKDLDPITRECGWY